jgi:hypothetical protein
MAAQPYPSFPDINNIFDVGNPSLQTPLSWKFGILVPGWKVRNPEQERNFTGTWSWFLKKLQNIDGRSLDFVAGSDGAVIAMSQGYVIFGGVYIVLTS